MAEAQKIIPITCTGTSAISISELVDLQGNLKSRTAEQIGKLRNQILKHGFSFPFFVWKDKKINYTLDGHGRTGVVKTLLEEGYLFKNGSGETTDKLPCDFISAKDKKEAKEKLLALNSQFGKITEQGFNDFINELNFEIDFESIKMDLELPEFEMVSLNNGISEELLGLPEFETFDGKLRIAIAFDNESEREKYDTEYNLRSYKSGKTWSANYPYKEKQDLNSLRYDGDSDGE